MNAYQHKHTGEIRAQEFSPGDDWEWICSDTKNHFSFLFLDFLVFSGCALALFIAWAKGG